MSDLGPREWVEMILSLPDDMRQRKEQVQAAALAEVGIKVAQTLNGGVVCDDDPRTESLRHRAHEIACKAVGIPSLPFAAWRAASDAHPPWWLSRGTS